MSKKDIEKKLFSIISKKTKDKVLLESTLKNLNIDSLDILDLVITVEKEFNISVKDEEIANFKTVNDILEYILKLI